MADDNHENGTSNGDVPEIELIIKVSVPHARSGIVIGVKWLAKWWEGRGGEQMKTVEKAIVSRARYMGVE